MTVKTASARQTADFGEGFAKNLKNGGVVALYGNLGAGKTTLVQGIARGLGVKKRLISPTFILVRRYAIKSKVKSEKLKVQLKNQKFLWHVDLYRLNSIGEAKAVGIEELMTDKGNIVLIEWADRIAGILPEKRWDVQMEIISAEEREITYEALH